MKNSKLKIIALLIITLMLLPIFCLQTEAETIIHEKIVLKKSEEEFLIYYKDICNKEFEFAISTNPSESEANLVFTKSGLDQQNENSLNVAYVDKDIYDTYFKNNNNKAYLWIVDENDNLVVVADPVNLTEALNDEKIDLVNKTTIVNNKTDRIEVDTTKTHETKQVIDGVDTTITTGKIVIKGKDKAKYSYELVKVSDNNANAKELFNTAEALKEETNNTYKNLSLTKKFYDLYNELMPDAKDWTQVENLEILQPDNTVEGDKYIVYIKEETSKGSTVDVKFLTCVYKEDKGVNQEEKTITETVKLPVTFDSGIILFIILGIIVLALVIFGMFRLRTNKKDENK